MPPYKLMATALVSASMAVAAPTGRLILPAAPNATTTYVAAKTTDAATAYPDVHVPHYGQDSVFRGAHQDYNGTFDPTYKPAVVEVHDTVSSVDGMVYHANDPTITSEDIKISPVDGMPHHKNDPTTILERDFTSSFDKFDDAMHPGAHRHDKVSTAYECPDDGLPRDPKNECQVHANYPDSNYYNLEVDGKLDDYLTEWMKNPTPPKRPSHNAPPPVDNQKARDVEAKKFLEFRNGTWWEVHVSKNITKAKGFIKHPRPIPIGEHPHHRNLTVAATPATINTSDSTPTPVLETRKFHNVTLWKNASKKNGTAVSHHNIVVTGVKKHPSVSITVGHHQVGHHNATTEGHEKLMGGPAWRKVHSMEQPETTATLALEAREPLKIKSPWKNHHNSTDLPSVEVNLPSVKVDLPSVKINLPAGFTHITGFKTIVVPKTTPTATAT